MPFPTKNEPGLLRATAGSRIGKGKYKSKITCDRKEGSTPTQQIWDNLNTKINMFYNGSWHYKIRIYGSKLLIKDIYRSKVRAVFRMLTVKINRGSDRTGKKNHNFSTFRVKTASGKNHQ